MAWGYWNRFRRVIVQTHLGYVQSILKKIKYNSNEKFKEGLFNFISLPFIFMY